MTKKRVWQQGAFCIDLEGPISEAIATLTKIVAEQGPTAKLVWDLRDVYSDSDRESLYVAVEREETDEEYRQRLANEKATKDRQEAWDRAQYERLQKKYDS